MFAHLLNANPQHKQSLFALDRHLADLLHGSICLSCQSPIVRLIEEDLLNEANASGSRMLTKSQKSNCKDTALLRVQRFLRAVAGMDSARTRLHSAGMDLEYLRKWLFPEFITGCVHPPDIFFTLLCKGITQHCREVERQQQHAHTFDNFHPKRFREWHLEFTRNMNFASPEQHEKMYHRLLFDPVSDLEHAHGRIHYSWYQSPSRRLDYAERFASLAGEGQNRNDSNDGSHDGDMDHNVTSRRGDHASNGNSNDGDMEDDVPSRRGRRAERFPAETGQNGFHDGDDDDMYIDDNEVDDDEDVDDGDMFHDGVHNLTGLLYQGCITPLILCCVSNP